MDNEGTDAVLAYFQERARSTVPDVTLPAIQHVCGLTRADVEHAIGFLWETGKIGSTDHGWRLIEPHAEFRAETADA